MGKMLVVGITGRSGSGKSKVTGYYASLGYPTVDGDQISREVCEKGHPCLDKLVAAFGRGILAPDGSLLRQRLGEIAFATPEGNQKLISITHPYIMGETLRRQEEARALGAELFFVDGAMIIGGMFEARCDRLIVVVSKIKLSISRIILRDGISKVSAQSRLAAQLGEDEMRAAADYVINNNGSEATLEQRADEVLKALLTEVESR